MVDRSDEDRDMIRIDLEEVFGKVIQISAHDADRVIPKDNTLVLVLGAEDGAIFLTHVDGVVMDITGRISDKLDNDSIVVDMPELKVSLTKDSLTTEGLNILNQAIQMALTSGVLTYFQNGAPGYEVVHHANSRNYRHALSTMATAAAYRSGQRAKVTPRYY